MKPLHPILTISLGLIVGVLYGICYRLGEIIKLLELLTN